MQPRSPEILFERPDPQAPLRRSAREVLAFAFARGMNETELLSQFIRRSLRSSVDPKTIESDLFLDELIQSSFSIPMGDRPHALFRPSLKRILLQPPNAQADIEFRQEIMGELASQAEVERRVRRSFEALRELVRSLFEATSLTSKGAALRRRLQILQCFVGALQSLSVIAAESQGLQRLSIFAGHALSSPAVVRLREVLAFEEARTVLDVRLKVGADGTLRHVDVLGSTESALSRHPRGAAHRFFRALWGALRGHRFSEEDILSQLIEASFASIEDLIASLLDVYLGLEFYFGCLAFRERAKRAGLPTVLPSFSGSPRRYEALWNPWLLTGSRVPVPSSLTFGSSSGSTILTGPNSGGKTRLLQAIAITQLLGQAGAFVPAAQAELAPAPQMYFSLIERPTAESDEGRLGSELRRIRAVFEKCGPGSLVIMDELCSGTNPSEGEEIFMMVLELFDELRPVVFVSTHFLDFADRLAKTRGGSIDFLQVELEVDGHPTFRFVPGVAKTSLASRTAERLGVTREELRRLAAERRAPLAASADREPSEER